MKNETLTTVLVIGVIAVAAYVLVRGIGTQGAPLKLADAGGTDTSLDGIRNIGASIKSAVGGLFGGDETIGTRPDGSLDVKSVRIEDQSSGASMVPGLTLSTFG
jgi:hypothetical protein